MPPKPIAIKNFQFFLNSVKILAIISIHLLYLYLEIEAKNSSFENKYIQSATFNGESLNSVFIDHSDLMKGGKLVFEMGNKANRSWGIE